jgi:phosphoserine phosphatase
MPPPVVVFDFDGTLTSRDSLVDFSFAYARAHPARLPFVILLAPVSMLLLARSQKAAGSVLLWAMTVGVSPRSFVRALRRYARSTLRRHTREPVFLELERQLDAGARVVIATGSLPVLVRELLLARGIARIPVAGSKLKRCLGGFVSRTHCTGQVKVDELERRFGITSWTAVYTNSISDRALMSRAQQITLVCPSSRSLRLTRLLASGDKNLRVVCPRQAS